MNLFSQKINSSSKLPNFIYQSLASNIQPFNLLPFQSIKFSNPKTKWSFAHIKTTFQNFNKLIQSHNKTSYPHARTLLSYSCMKQIYLQMQLLSIMNIQTNDDIINYLSSFIFQKQGVRKTQINKQINYTNNKENVFNMVPQLEKEKESIEMKKSPQKMHDSNTDYRLIQNNKDQDMKKIHTSNNERENRKRRLYLSQNTSRKITVANGQKYPRQGLFMKNQKLYWMSKIKQKCEQMTENAEFFARKEMIKSANSARKLVMKSYLSKQKLFDYPFNGQKQKVNPKKTDFKKGESD